ncbi:MAG: glycosyltransferase family 39 protein, partial [Thermoplasmata archaeon]|nr:glycosyltransferase family 39 protein [Thermoplasmata archaeon]
MKLKSRRNSETFDLEGSEEVEEPEGQSSDLHEGPPKEIKKLRRRFYKEQKGTPPPEKQSSPSSLQRKITTKWQVSWLKNHWKTIVVLLFIFCLALFVRGYYGLETATEDGFLLSGGSDSYYHNLVIDDILDTGKHRFWDNMLNYPVGSRNPRPPLYDWSVGLGGIALSPFFNDVDTSMFYVFLFSTAFWGAMTIFPVYFLAKEAFGRKTGIVAAFLLAVMPGHIQRSVLSNADHDAMALFFIVTAFFFFLKALKLLEQKEWIGSWKEPKAIWNGLKDLASNNTHSFLYAAMAGLSIAGAALIWKGYAYAIVILTVYLLVQVLINRFRNRDSLAVVAIYFITVGVGLLIAFPYYYQSILIKSWFDTPMILFFAATGLSLVLIVTNKYPWVLVFTS